MIRRSRQTKSTFIQYPVCVITVFLVSSCDASVNAQVKQQDGSVNVSRRTQHRVSTINHLASHEPLGSALDSSENFTIGLSRCLSHRGNLSVPVTSAPLVISRWGSDDLANSSLSCVLNVVTTPDKALHVTHTGCGLVCSWKNRYIIHRECWTPLEVSDTFCKTRSYTSEKNTLTIEVVLEEPPGKSVISIETLGKHLETGNYTANAGYIQSPGYDSKNKYPPNIDSWLQISVTSDHVTLVSFQYIRTSAIGPNLSCSGSDADTVRLYTGSNFAKALLWEACEFYVPLPDVYDASVLYVHFCSFVIADWVYFVFRFKLFYSFHPTASQPSRVSNVLWNCSVPEWPKFQHHFRCNLAKECEAGEDEAPCSYTGHCGQGYLTLNGRCYMYLPSYMTLHTWRGSNLECQRLGGYLASLNTPGEWRAVVDTLKTRRYPADVYVGLHDVPSVLPLMYRHVNMWTDKSVAYFVKTSRTLGHCAMFTERMDDTLKQTMQCDHNDHYFVNSLCEFDRPVSAVRGSFEDGRRFHIEVRAPRNTSFAAITPVVCPAGHVTHAFLACDSESACWLGRLVYGDIDARGVPSGASCPAPMTSLPLMFACQTGLQRVPYGFVCDHRRQCTDGSDETFCVFPPCSGSTPLQCATSRQCVAASSLCDSQADCLHKADEVQCDFYINDKITTLPPPAVVRFTPLSVTDTFTSPLAFTPLPPPSPPLPHRPSACPETHFQCPGDGYCLPVFVRCNGVIDCPGREDEAGCDDVLCPGFYRCHSSAVCLHSSHVCDGVYQCPQQDDELFCRLVCPAGCTCHGLNFVCRQPFPAELHPRVRYLDAGGSGLTPNSLMMNTFLIHLGLSECGLTTLHNMTFPNLRSLDLSHNRLRVIRADHLRGVLNLRYMSLSGNPLKTLFSSDAKNRSFPALRTLDVSGVTIHRLDARTLSLFPGLHTLNLSKCDLHHVDSESFRANSKLRVLDIVGCPMTHFSRDLFSRLEQLQDLRADNFKLCCPVMLPTGFNQANCRAPFDELSSCESLLRSDVYRISLSIFSSLASVGNLGCFLLRSLVLKSKASGFGVFVHHLTISDFLMGVYMSVIGVADRLYMGSYLWEDLSWRHSAACGAAGFLSLMSNEVSALVICLITLDRFLVLRFPFSSLRFKARSAHVTCAVVWVTATVMAALPLTPLASHWSFYSQTGICIPLPITRRDFAGERYAFGVMIVFNFILFIFIAAGQAAIYVSIQANRLSTADSTKKSTDLRIARRLISVAVSDFLCWFPIGLLGLLASRGVPISGEANVGIAILVLPLNSTLNPFLYTINVLLERRAKLRDERVLKHLMEHPCEE